MESTGACMCFVKRGGERIATTENIMMKIRTVPTCRKDTIQKGNAWSCVAVGLVLDHRTAC
jgi:hypothetical protein